MSSIPADRPLRIGLIAPPWVPVPPPSYGGTELVIDSLCLGLQRAGHDVTLFTTGDSTIDVRRRSLFEQSDPDRMGATVLELRHVAAAYDALRHVDIIHDHTLAGLFLNHDVTPPPVVTTIHGPFNDDLTDLYGRVADRVPIIAISADQASHAPSSLPIAKVIHHGIDVSRYRYSGWASASDPVVFLGRMSPDKGVETAIRVAKKAGMRLVMAAKMREPNEHRYYEEVVAPMMGKDAEYVGEADFDTKVELLAGARALLNPIAWPEPFGLVMIEAMACGTPVVGYPAGAAPEIVTPGVNGFLARNESSLVDGLLNVGLIDRARCRQTVIDRFSQERMATDHVALYRQVLAHSSTPQSVHSTPARPTVIHRPDDRACADDQEVEDCPGQLILLP